MKALTVIQPWASLIVSGNKKIETRSWKTSFRGEILIHASKKDMTHSLADRMTASEFKYFVRCGIGFSSLPTGSIIGVVTISDCILMTDEFIRKLKKEDPQEFAFGDYEAGRYAWILKDPKTMVPPARNIKGKLGLWNSEISLEGWTNDGRR